MAVNTPTREHMVLRAANAVVGRTDTGDSLSSDGVKDHKLEDAMVGVLKKLNC